MTALLHFTHTPAMTLHERAVRAIRDQWARRQAAYVAKRRKWAAEHTNRERVK